VQQQEDNKDHPGEDRHHLDEAAGDEPEAAHVTP
jgi:hypothetical protein